jgi:hypothetical protein
MLLGEGEMEGRRTHPQPPRRGHVFKNAQDLGAQQSS